MQITCYYKLLLTCVTSGIKVCSIDFVRISRDILESFRPRLDCLVAAIAEHQPRFENNFKVVITKFKLQLCVGMDSRRVCLSCGQNMLCKVKKKKLQEVNGRTIDGSGSFRPVLGMGRFGSVAGAFRPNFNMVGYHRFIRWTEGQTDG